MCNPPQTSPSSNQESPPKPETPHDVMPAPVVATTSPFRKTVQEAWALIQLASPLLLTSLLLFCRAFASTHFLGTLGCNELAGGTLAITFANITGISVLTGLSSGMEPICSQAFGAGRLRELSLTLHRAVLFLLAASIPIAILWTNLPLILSLINQEPAVIKIAHTYILYSLPDLVTNSFLNPTKNYLRTQGITRPLTCSTLAGTIIHVAADVILVDFLGLGVASISIAATISNLLSLFILIAYVWIARLHEPTWMSPSRACLKKEGWGELVKLSWASGLTVCLEWWWYEIMTFLGGNLGNKTPMVGSMGILIQATGFIYNFPSALGSAVSVRVGNELGGGSAESARRVAVVGISFAALLGVVAAGFAGGMKDVWGRMYSGDAEILKLTALVMPIMAVCELGNCPQTVACAVVRGTARPRVGARVNFVAFYVVGMPVAVGLAFYGGFGLVWLWVGHLVAQICCVGAMLYVVWATDWDLEAERAHVLTSAAATGTGVGGLEDGVAEEGGGDLREPLLEVAVDPPA